MNAISLQLVRGYATTRALVWMIPTILIPSLIGAWLSTRLASTNQVTPVVMPGIVAGSAIAALVVSPFGELDELHRQLLRPVRMAGLLLGLILACGLFLAIGWIMYDLESAEAVLIRTLVGTCGLALVGVRAIGRAAGVLPASAWGIASLFSIQSDNGYPAWAWQLQPASDRPAWAIALFLLAIGAGALWNMPFSRGH